MGKSPKQVLQYVQKAINDCWESQGVLDPEDVEFKELDQQLIAYQDIHVFLAGEEFTGEEVSEDDSTPTEPEEEPDKVLEVHDDTKSEDEDDEEPEEET